MAEPLISDSPISEKFKREFKEGKKYGKIRGITIIVKSEKDIDNIISLIDIKLRIK